MALLAARPAAVAVKSAVSKSVLRAAPVVARPRSLPVPSRIGARSLVVRAAEGEDFDAFLNKIADKFEKTENKPVVIGYVAAAVAAFITAEWLIHLPALDILLGFPVQVVGLLALPYLGVRWFVDGESAGKDIEAAAGKIISKLPGLDK